MNYYFCETITHIVWDLNIIIHIMSFDNLQYHFNKCSEFRNNFHVLQVNSFRIKYMKIYLIMNILEIQNKILVFSIHYFNQET